MWLPNEPVWVCSPNFLTGAVSPETLLCTFLGFCFSSGSVCVFLCVFMSAFFQAGYQISTFTQQPLPHLRHLPHLLLCLCKWSSHLGLMKAGIKYECETAADRFYPALRSRDGEGAGVDTSAHGQKPRPRYDGSHLEAYLCGYPKFISQVFLHLRTSF